jgi:proteasome accessory factor C
VRELPEGRLLVRLRAADDRWLRTLALRQGGAVRVLEPAGLADEVAERARTALAGYPAP